MTLGKLLRQARKKKGWTIKQLADVVGVSGVSICYYENDKRVPKLDHLKWLAQALNLSLSELIERI